MTDEPIPDFLWNFFQQLRRRQFPIGIDDYQTLCQSLHAGFGWSSRRALRDLCGALWAKSHREQQILEALFDQLPDKDLADWKLPKLELAQPVTPLDVPVVSEADKREEKLTEQEEDEIGLSEAKTQEAETEPVVEAHTGLPPIRLDGVKLPERSFVFEPQFPLTYREVAQAWRHLRRPVREGPPIELDIEATIARRCQQGVASPVVLVPRRRNTTRLLLLVDRQGSMAPFHRFVAEICTAIQQSGKLGEVAIYYFHDVPAEGADETVLSPVADQLFPTLDDVLPEINPLTEGYLYNDPDLLSPVPLANVLQENAVEAAVALVSDGGAARGSNDTIRLLDTIAFMKALRACASQYVWLNPIPERKRWTKSTAAQIARHVPMCSLNKDGIYRAVNVLRGHPYAAEKPL